MSTDPESHEYEVERVVAADPEAVFDGFVEIFDGDDRPDWILSSEMDLRVGGAWTIELELPGMEPFTEIRTITELDRPKRLAYSMTTRGVGSEEPVSTEVGLSFVLRSGQTLASSTSGDSAAGNRPRSSSGRGRRCWRFCRKESTADRVGGRPGPRGDVAFDRARSFSLPVECGMSSGPRQHRVRYRAGPAYRLVAVGVPN